MHAKHCLALLCLTALNAGVVHAQQPAQEQAAPTLGVKPVKPDVFMITGAGGNAAIVVGPSGVVLIDTKSPGQANFDALMAKIASVTPLPVKEVLVTHHHPDHSGNIDRFEAAGVPVVGQAGLPAALKTFSATRPTPLAAPNVVFARRLVVNAGGIKVEARYLGAGHTGNDAVYYFPAQKLVLAGDEVEATPQIDYPFGASIAGWLKCLNGIAKLDFDTIIPGHGGEAMTKAQFLTYKKNAETFAARARAAVKSGVPKDKLLASIKTDDLGWPVTTPAWTMQARLDGLYAELAH